MEILKNILLYFIAFFCLLTLANWQELSYFLQITSVLAIITIASKIFLSQLWKKENIKFYKHLSGVVYIMFLPFLSAIFAFVDARKSYERIENEMLREPTSLSFFLASMLFIFLIAILVIIINDGKNLYYYYYPKEVKNKDGFMSRL